LVLVLVLVLVFFRAPTKDSDQDRISKDCEGKMGRAIYNRKKRGTLAERERERK
jgi:hypothetical protein